MKNDTIHIVGLEIGEQAPEIEFQNPEGEIIKLSSLRGKLVLIDFWASWCLPCRRENPNVVAAYHEFKNKEFIDGNGFAVYSVSLDSNKSEWKKAIMQDGLIWDYHVSDLKKWKSEVVKKYQIWAIPSNYLIDSEGIIVAKNLRDDELFEVLDRLVITK